MNKVFNPLFDFFEWLHHHKKRKFLFSWGLLTAVFSVSDIHYYDWPRSLGWLFLMVLMTIFQYIEGRLDEQAVKDDRMARRIVEEIAVKLKEMNMKGTVTVERKYDNK